MFALIEHKLFILLLSNGKVFLFLKDLHVLRSITMPKKKPKHTQEQTPNSGNNQPIPTTSSAGSSASQEKPKRSAFARWPSMKRAPTETLEATSPDDSSTRINALLTTGAAESEGHVVSQQGVEEVIAIQRKFRAGKPSAPASEEHKNDDEDDPTNVLTAVFSGSVVPETSSQNTVGSPSTPPLPASSQAETVAPVAVNSSAPPSPPPSPRADDAAPVAVAAPPVVSPGDVDTEPARHSVLPSFDQTPPSRTASPVGGMPEPVSHHDDATSVLAFPERPVDNTAAIQAFTEKVALRKLTPFMMDKQPTLEKRVALKQDLHQLLTDNLEGLTSTLKTKLVSDQYEEKVKEIYNSILVEMEPLAKEASKKKLDSFKGWFDGMLESHKNSFPEKNWIWHNYVKKALSTLLGVIVVAATLAFRPFIAGLAEYAGSFFETPETSGFKMFKESALKAKETAEADVENTINTLPALGA